MYFYFKARITSLETTNINYNQLLIPPKTQAIKRTDLFPYLSRNLFKIIYKSWWVMSSTEEVYKKAFYENLNPYLRYIGSVFVWNRKTLNLKPHSLQQIMKPM
jgi:hypothetical protein